MKERVEKAQERFKDHKATLVTDMDEVTVIDWKDKNGSSNYFVRYIISKNYYGDIIVTGDLGDAIIETFWNEEDLSIKEISRLIPEHNISYLNGKIKTDNDRYDYNPEDAEKELREVLQECDIDEDEDGDIEEIISDIMGDWDCYSGLGRNAYEIMSEYDPDCWEWIGSCGRSISTRFILWVVGLIMACRQICEER